MNNQPFQNLSRRDLCAVIFRHKKKVLFIPLAAILVGSLVLLYFPRTYRSEAQVFLRLGRENIGLDPTATTGQTIVTQNSDRKDEVASVMDVIQSRGVIAKAVDQVGAEAVLSDGAPRKSEANWLSQAVVPLQVVSGWLKEIDPISDRERAIIKVEKSLRVLADRGSTLVSISCDAKTPQAAQSLCSAIVEVYQQEHMRIHRSEDSRPFFAEQHDRLRKQLDDSLESLRNVKNEKGLPSVEERRQTLEAQFSAVELARLNTQQQIAMSDARIVELERQLAEVPERLIDSKKNIPNSGADLLRQQLYNLQMTSMDLEARYSDAHPLVVAVNGQVQEAQRVLAQQTSERTETTDSVNPIHRQLSLELKQIRSQYAGLKSTLVELNDQKESVLADLRALNDNELTIDQLSRQAELARNNFMHYAQNMEEARLDTELETDRISNLSVVQEATLAERPVSPSKPMVVMATLILASIGTAALILTSEAFNDRLRSEEDVARALELPVLASIPRGRTGSCVPAVKSNGAATLTGSRN